MVTGMSVYIANPGSHIAIGKDFTMEGGGIASTEGAGIIIGDDCMFSFNLDVRNGDSHPIYSLETGRRINDARDIVIGNHVWLCAFTKIMKGTVIPDDCIIGNSSLVSSSLDKPHSLYAGVPAKFLKTGLTWGRHRN